MACQTNQYLAQIMEGDIQSNPYLSSFTVHSYMEWEKSFLHGMLSLVHCTYSNLWPHTDPYVGTIGFHRLRKNIEDMQFGGWSVKSQEELDSEDGQVWGYNQNTFLTSLQFSKDKLKILYIWKDILRNNEIICTIFFFLNRLSQLYFLNWLWYINRKYDMMRNSVFFQVIIYMIILSRV